MGPSPPAGRHPPARLPIDGATTAAQVAHALRTLAHERPATFRLIMLPPPGVPSIGVEHAELSTRTMLLVIRRLAGDEHALDAARTLTAWATDFVGMELNGSFQLGGDLQSAWEYGLHTVITAISNTASTQQ